MKTENEVRSVLVSHRNNTFSLRSRPSLLKKHAKTLGWSEEYLKGYQDGVEWAYIWFLQKEGE